MTRLKSDTRLTVVAENRVSRDGPILSDRIGYLGASRTNPFQAPVREIRVRIDSGKILRILPNDIDWFALGDPIPARRAAKETCAVARDMTEHEGSRRAGDIVCNRNIPLLTFERRSCDDLPTELTAAEEDDVPIPTVISPEPHKRIRLANPALTTVKKLYLVMPSEGVRDFVPELLEQR